MISRVLVIYIYKNRKLNVEKKRLIIQITPYNKKKDTKKKCIKKSHINIIIRIFAKLI